MVVCGGVGKTKVYGHCGVGMVMEVLMVDDGEAVSEFYGGVS